MGNNKSSSSNANPGHVQPPQASNASPVPPPPASVAQQPTNQQMVMNTPVQEETKPALTNNPGTYEDIHKKTKGDELFASLNML